MNKRSCTPMATAIVLVGLLLATPSLMSADDYSLSENFDNCTGIAPLKSPAAVMQADFGGTLRLYIVEPVSRWNDNSGKPYHYGFMDFALDSAIALNNGDRIHLSRIWDASTSGYGGYHEDNIMVQAAVFNDEPVQAYAYTPPQNPFWAYYTEASAAAVPGTVDSNSTEGGYTHTVFLEKGTAQWCIYCPTTNYYLNNVNSLGYNFHYVAMITDYSDLAYVYMGTQFNLAAYPTTFYDGGDELVIGGASGNSTYINPLNACGARATEGANVMVKTEWLGLGDLQIDVVVTFGAPLNDTPEAGQASGELNPMIETGYTFSATGTDNNGDDIWYMWNWGDGQVSDWIGPYAAGTACDLAHTWDAVGTYDVTVKTRDFWNAESDWSTPLAVTAQCCVLRGNVDGAGLVNVSDLTYLVAYLFSGGANPVCAEEGDIDSSGTTNVSDLTFLVAYLFSGGPEASACQ